MCTNFTNQSLMLSNPQNNILTFRSILKNILQQALPLAFYKGLTCCEESRRRRRGDSRSKKRKPPSRAVISENQDTVVCSGLSNFFTTNTLYVVCVCAYTFWCMSDCFAIMHNRINVLKGCLEGKLSYYPQSA